MTKVAIVIVNYHGSEVTRDCLISLLELDRQQLSLEIILVDNNSPGFSAKEMRELYPGLQIIINPVNLGFAEGNNVGIRRALKNKADFIMLLNNDTVVDSELIKKLLLVFDNDQTVGIVSPKIYFQRNYEFHKSKYNSREKGKVIWYAGGLIDWDNVYASHRGVDVVDHRQHDDISETEFATGCCMMVKREVFERIGLFDRNYFLYYEDVDLSQRARLEGYKILYDPDGVIWHKNAASSDKPGSVLHLYYQTRNRLIFGFKYAKLRTRIALLKESLFQLGAGGIRQKAVWDYYSHKWGKVKNL